MSRVAQTVSFAGDCALHLPMALYLAATNCQDDCTGKQTQGSMTWPRVERQAFLGGQLRPICSQLSLDDHDDDQAIGGPAGAKSLGL